MLFTMQVYVELALLENFCMDFTLLYAAKSVVKNRASKKRLAVAAALGACFAVVFPLFNLPPVWSAAIKIVSGLLICLIAGRFKNLKGYLKFTGAFLVFTAVLGGALIGVFSLAGTEYVQGNGYTLSSIPVGIPLFCGLFVILGAKKLAARLKKTAANDVICRISAGELHAEVKGFFDSGNKVYCRGAPVSVLPKDTAQKLLSAARIESGVKIHTVAGSKNMEVFTADRVEVDFGTTKKIFENVKFGVSPNRIPRAVMHCDLLEE